MVEMFLAAGRYLLKTLVTSVVQSSVKRALEPAVRAASHPQLPVEERDQPLSGIEYLEVEANTRLNLTRIERIEDGESRAYPLPYQGYLRDRLPKDSVPALMLNDVVWTEGRRESQWISLWKPLHGLTIELDKLGLCHDVSIISPQSEAKVFHYLQAVDICIREFPDRPAIIVFHTGDRSVVDTYAVIYGFSSEGPRRMQLVHISRVTQVRLEADAKSAMDSLRSTSEVEAGNPSDWVAPELPSFGDGLSYPLFTLPFLILSGSILDAYQVREGSGLGRLGGLLAQEAARLHFSNEETVSLEEAYAKALHEALQPEDSLLISRYHSALRDLTLSGYDTEYLHSPSFSYLSVKPSTSLDQFAIIVTFDSGLDELCPNIFVERAGVLEAIEIDPASWIASSTNLIGMVAALSETCS